MTYLTSENLTLLLLNENKKGPKFYYHLYSITWKHLNIDECMINLKTLNYSSAFHSLPLEKNMASFRDKTRSKNQWVNYSKSKYRRHCQGGCRHKKKKNLCGLFFSFPLKQSFTHNHKAAGGKKKTLMAWMQTKFWKQVVDWT